MSATLHTGAPNPGRAEPALIGGADVVEPDPAPGRVSGKLYQQGDIIAQKYRLVRLLGEGGMGAVWLARNEKLEVEVAIKLIRCELATEETAGRLLQEARAAARIGHRSIVRVFDFGETELDDPFIVMEVLTGESLRALLERKSRRLPATNAVRTLLPIASALCDAHAAGIVHRDLKPENIMLVPDSSGGVVPKLVDFGIAKLRRVGRDAGETPAPGAVGTVGEYERRRTPLVVAGTPDYMSPEQAGGREEVTEAADVWALAVILYEAITGRVPFEGPSYPALIFAIMTADPTATHEQLAGDARLWGILQGALAKQASQRPTMRAFGTALARWAVAAGADSDVAGTSLSAHWLNTTSQSPFSALPPALEDEEEAAFDPEMPLPKPGGLPSLRASTGRALGRNDASTVVPEPPAVPIVTPPSTARANRGLGAAWIGVAGVLVAASILVASTRRGATSPLPPAPIATASLTTAIAPGTATPPPPETAAPVPSLSPPAPVEPIETAAPPVSPSAPPLRWVPKPLPPRPSRKSTLPIAKKPDF